MHNYKKLDDILNDNALDLLIDRPASINIMVKSGKLISCNYQGNFADVIGLSLDMINGLVSQYDSDGQSALYILSSIKNCDSLINTFSIDKNKIESSVYIDIAEDRNIKSLYTGNLMGHIMAFNCFIKKFCNDNNLDPKEYNELLNDSYVKFINNKCPDKMNVIEL